MHEQYFLWVRGVRYPVVCAGGVAIMFALTLTSLTNLWKSNGKHRGLWTVLPPAPILSIVTIIYRVRGNDQNWGPFCNKLISNFPVEQGIREWISKNVNILSSKAPEA